MQSKVLLISTFIFLTFVFRTVNTAVQVVNIDMRPPKWNDIGLFFDVNLLNTVDQVKSSYEVKIRCEKCCISLPVNGTTCDTLKLIGGAFGFIEPSVSKKVSIIWPTVTLYNRLGSCDIVVVSHNNSYDKKSKISRTIKFNTMITKTSVPDIMKEFISGKTFVDCPTLDLNPFQKCEPVLCEEKYFGKRNFFNHTTSLCEPVPVCNEGFIYDFIVNECIDPHHPICMDDIKAISEGQYDNNVWQFRKYIPQWNQEFYDYTDEDEEEMETTQKSKRQVFKPWMGVVNFFLIIAQVAICLVIIAAIIYIIFFGVSKLKKRKAKKAENGKK